MAYKHQFSAFPTSPKPSSTIIQITLPPYQTMKPRMEGMLIRIGIVCNKILLVPVLIVLCCPKCYNDAEHYWNKKVARSRRGTDLLHCHRHVELYRQLQSEIFHTHAEKHRLYACRGRSGSKYFLRLLETMLSLDPNAATTQPYLL